MSKAFGRQGEQQRVQSLPNRTTQGRQRGGREQQQPTGSGSKTTGKCPRSKTTGKTPWQTERLRQIMMEADGSYQEGLDRGYEEGYWEGYEEGHDEGSVVGYEAGRRQEERMEYEWTNEP
jgi:flagellar biosynthesis/type III secretory pathway protein FliH